MRFSASPQHYQTISLLWISFHKSPKQKSWRELSKNHIQNKSNNEQTVTAHFAVVCAKDQSAHTIVQSYKGNFLLQQQSAIAMWLEWSCRKWLLACSKRSAILRYCELIGIGFGWLEIEVKWRGCGNCKFYKRCESGTLGTEIALWSVQMEI